MLKLDHFWEEEAGAPLLMHDKGFIREMGDEIWEVTAKWPGLAGVEEPVPELPPYDEEKVSRIVLRDAERTFFGDKQRQRCCHVLSILENHYGDYGQGLGYAAGFLMLFFEPEVVVAICRNLADNEKYIPGYWGLEAVPPVVDAHVFGAFAGNFFPEVAGHLEAKTVAAKTYTQKWFVGLCVHVLHFKPLFQFWEAFLTEGYPFLFKFALAHFTEAGPMLLAAESHVDLFGILRLDPEFTDDDLRERIATTAVAMDVGDPQEFIGAIQGLRVEMFENVVKPRMEATAKYNEEHASDDEVDWDAEGDECQVCEGFPEVYWAAHDIILCNGCVDKGVEEGDILGHPFDKESAGLISHAAYERDVKGKDGGGDDDDDGGDGDGDAVDAAVDALADDVAQIQIAAEDGGN